MDIEYDGDKTTNRADDGSFAEMALRVVPRRVMDERFAQQELDLVVCPALCGKRLKKHDNALARIVSWTT